MFLILTWRLKVSASNSLFFCTRLASPANAKSHGSLIQQGTHCQVSNNVFKLMIIGMGKFALRPFHALKKTITYH